MNSQNNLYFAASVFIVAAVTWLTRALPFLMFGNRPLPRTVRYLGYALPPAIMITLVCYCLRNISFAEYTGWIPQLFACAVVALIQLVRKNMYVSIIAGTVCYMVLLRIV